MKITTTRSVTNNFAGLETHKVGIAANGKAFSGLVKGIYENKIQAFVRELSTNALDGHIVAGVEDQPFHVSFPDLFDPYFRVRDYGCSMDHEHVVNIFGTLFESSKDQSNDVVGAFGLGSKSPLAYADSFEVRAFLNGEERIYLVTIGDDGAPQITVLGKVATDKPNGIEVAVPIEEVHFTRVLEEGRKVLRAFDVLPTTNGVEIQPMKRYVDVDLGGGVKAFVIDSKESSLFVRQGCVMYPVDDFTLTQHTRGIRAYDNALVLDVPIGTFSVTLSREALELDENARQKIASLTGEAMKVIEVKIEADLAKFPNRLKAVEAYTEGNFGGFWIKPLKFRGERLDNWLHLTGNPNRSGDAISVKVGTKRGVSVLQQMCWSDARQALFVTEYPERDAHLKLKRTIMRYRKVVEERGDKLTYLLTNPTPRTLERLTRLLGLRSDQIVWVGSLEDPGPPQSDKVSTVDGYVPGVTTPNSRNNKVKAEDMAEEFYWIEATRPNMNERWEFRQMAYRVRSAGGRAIPVYVLNKQAVKNLKPNPELELRNAWKLIMDSHVDALKEHRLYRMLLARLPIEARFLAEAPESTVPQAIVDVGELTSEELSELAEEAQRQVADWKAKYPLMINPTDQELRAYVAQCDEAAEA